MNGRACDGGASLMVCKVSYICVCECVCVYICIYVNWRARATAVHPSWFVKSRMYVCMYIRACVDMYVCMYVYTCVCRCVYRYI